MPHRRRSSSYQLLRLVEDTGQIGFWSIDLVTGEMQGSPSLAHITGLTESTGPRGVLDSLIHPDDRAGQATLLDMLHDGRAVARTFRIIRPDRTVRWVTVKAQVVLGPDDHPVRAEGIVFDVTEPHEARLAAEQSQARYRGLIEAIAAVVWTTSPDGRPRPSASWQALTGQPAQAMQGYGWLDTIHPEDRQRALEAWRTAVLHQTSYDTDYRVLCADGQWRWFNSRATPLRNPDGSVREWIGVMLGIASSTRFPSDAARPLPQLTGALVRGARAILNWSVAELARVAGVSISSIKRFEEGSTTDTRPRTRVALQQTLERAGIRFVTAADGGSGIFLSTSPVTMASREDDRGGA
ncbi:PAS domain-containing protein [Methylobacterium sp.]|uniref:PAS domain-containing protein n=1 Tax=Methylobacterium sp. TaxID=409 RepID=UPI000C5B9AC4|nr:PAS domain-containing protein [Methylobacterium sp.]MBP32426.1 XRE family transcriptional regulator [Methylobacterium sp.]